MSSQSTYFPIDGPAGRVLDLYLGDLKITDISDSRPTKVRTSYVYYTPILRHTILYPYRPCMVDQGKIVDLA